MSEDLAVVIYQGEPLNYDLLLKMPGLTDQQRDLLHKPLKPDVVKYSPDGKPYIPWQVYLSVLRDVFGYGLQMQVMMARKVTSVPDAKGRKSRYAEALVRFILPGVGIVDMWGRQPIHAANQEPEAIKGAISSAISRLGAWFGIGEDLLSSGRWVYDPYEETEEPETDESLEEDDSEEETSEPEPEAVPVVAAPAPSAPERTSGKKPTKEQIERFDDLIAALGIEERAQINPALQLWNQEITSYKQLDAKTLEEFLDWAEDPDNMEQMEQCLGVA